MGSLRNTPRAPLVEVERIAAARLDEPAALLAAAAAEPDPEGARLDEPASEPARRPSADPAARPRNAARPAKPVRLDARAPAREDRRGLGKLATARVA